MVSSARQTAPAGSALDWPVGSPGRASSQFLGLAIKIPLEPFAVGLAGIEQERQGTWLAVLGPTGTCNHMHRTCTVICHKYSAMAQNTHKYAII